MLNLVQKYSAYLQIVCGVVCVNNCTHGKDVSSRLEQTELFPAESVLKE